MRRGSSCEMKDGVHVHRKGVHPTLFSDCVETAGDGSSGRMHENIEAAKVFDYLANAAAAGGGIGDVGFERADHCAMSLDSGE